MREKTENLKRFRQNVQTTKKERAKIVYSIEMDVVSIKRSIVIRI
jgi:hypothetical protein